MILKLKKGSVTAFMNKDIFYVDVKSVKLDRVLTNLFIKMYTDGRPVTLAFRKEYTIDILKENMSKLEDMGYINGVKDNPEGVEDWLRSSLLELVNRGNIIKEHVSTLKPLHILSFRVQNSKYCRDYRASDQLYLMLKSNPEVMNGLVKYLSKGWDKNTGDIVVQEDLDVDTTGILYLTKPLREKKNMNKEVDSVPLPFLKEQASLFNDDIRRLLIYKEKLPRAVFIDYLRILCGLHLALYTFKVIYLLPKMVEIGTRDVKDDWSMIVDLTDDLDSIVSQYACKDMERIENGFGKYIRSTYMADLIQERKECSIDEALRILKEDNDKQEYYELILNGIKKNLPEKDEKEFDQDDLAEMLAYFPEGDYFNMLVHILEKSNLGSYQYRYLREFIDSVSMKNSSSMLLADSRSKRHPRRGALGSKLLETLVQLLVLRQKEDGSYETCSLSIDELASAIRKRYGLIINGVGEERFADADVEMNSAFRINMDAFKNKLRQIGFYTDMSDACILQKIRPRYKLED
jgi:hypothetical protein